MDVRIHAAGTALVLLAMRDEGRLALSAAATEALARAEAIVEADRILGAVCGADLHDALVPQMAENAYAIGLLVQGLDAAGLADATPDQALFFSPVATRMSWCGFAVAAV